MKRSQGRLLSFLLIGTLGIGSVLTASAEDSEINQTQQEVNQLEQQKNNAVAQQTELAQKLNEIMSRMDTTKAQLDAKAQEIETTENALVSAKADENDQYNAMKKRIRYMYENGNTEFIQILFASESFTDLLNKAEYFTKVTEYDRNMLVEYQKTVKSVEKQEAELQSEYSELEGLQKSLNSQQAEVQTVLADKQVEITSLEATIGEKAAHLQELVRQAEEAEAARQAAEEAARQAEELRQQQASQKESSSSPPPASKPSGGSSNNSGSSSSGAFVHPCPAGHLTSGFGYRDFDKSSHKGVDFGTSGAYVPTYAAAAGTVITAGWSNSAGNWVVINHGNGLQTKYMHHSSLLVSEGDYVYAGQQIGITGNTGNSAGVHLHFQVEQNGTPVDPFNYL